MLGALFLPAGPSLRLGPSLSEVLELSPELGCLLLGLSLGLCAREWVRAGDLGGCVRWVRVYAAVWV